jgi:hypothetical protein
MISGRRKAVLFCKKEPKNFCPFGLRGGITRTPHLQKLFGSFFQKRPASLLLLATP